MNSDEDKVLVAFYSVTAPYVLKLSRSLLLAFVAAWLATYQRHTEYSVIAVWLLVFLLSVINRYHWVAGLLIVWLMALYFVTPEMITALKAVRG